MPGTKVHVPAPRGAAATAERARVFLPVMRAPSVPRSSLTLALSGLPLGRPQRVSTPLRQPPDGHEGQMARDVSSSATVVMTKDA